MRRLNRFLAVAATTALTLGVAGCVDSDPDEAQTPTGAPTAVNSAPQTDSDGNTVPAPGAPTEGGEETTEGGGEGAGGDVAAGEQFFASTCQGCHSNLGQVAGVGPKLAGAALAEGAVRTVLQDGRNAMPGGLASGDDLENVVAFVLSIQ